MSKCNLEAQMTMVAANLAALAYPMFAEAAHAAEHDDMVTAAAFQTVTKALSGASTALELAILLHRNKVHADEPNHAEESTAHSLAFMEHMTAASKEFFASNSESTDAGTPPPVDPSLPPN